MASQLFQLPRELRNTIYDLATHHEKPFANFEIPWNFLASLANDEIIEAPSEEHGKPATRRAIRMPRSVDEIRMLRAPAIIDYTLAFTCKQALAEHVEEHQHHTGNLPFMAFAVESKGGLWGVDESPAYQADRTISSSWEWLVMILKKQLPPNARVRVHYEIVLPGARTRSIYHQDFSKRLDQLPVAAFKHVNELESKLHTLAFSLRVTKDFRDKCNSFVGYEGSPVSIRVVWPRATLEFDRKRSQPNGKAWHWSIGERYITSWA
jgi:hypothetical protein